LDAAQRADEVFAALSEQSQDYYLIGFTPGEDASKHRGGYRPVTIRVRRAGAHVSTRTGFVLTDAAARLDRRQTIERAMSAPFPQQALPIEYTTYVLRGATAGLQRIIVSLSADLPMAAKTPSPADVAFVVRSATDGHIAASGHDTLSLPIQRNENETVGRGSYHVQFELPAGDYLMRAVVREPGGLVGSADRRFTVRALDGPALTSGDLVLSSRRGDLPVRPTAYTGDGLSGVVELYGRTIDQLEQARVTIDLVPVGETTPTVSGAADLEPVRATTNGAAREARLELPLQGVASGTYVARARVAVGLDTAVEVMREVEIRAGRRPSTTDETIEMAFDPRDVVNGTLARQYAAALRGTSEPGAIAALTGVERLAVRDYPGAIASFEAALATGVGEKPDSPRDAPAAFLLGWAFHGAGDDRRAISAWRRAAYLDPTIVPTHLALADIYVRLSQPALAVQALRAGLAALPDSPELLDRLSRLEQR
jgi:hypothetical protein